MSNMRHIRKHLGLRQHQLAEIVGVAQATVSRWESGELFPDMEDMIRIRDYAKSNGFEWEDAMFFEGSDQQAAE